MSRLTGILGGTFDPIHYGHLRPAYEVMEACGLEQVRFIPNSQPPHRQPPQLAAELRCELIELAIDKVPGFVLDRREIHRQGASYMVDTLASLHQECGDEHLCLIMGMDAFAGIRSWHRWQDILQLSHLIVTTRPGSDLSSISLDKELEGRISRQPQQLKDSQSGVILLQSVTQLDISASQIRHALDRGKGCHFLLPDIIREKLEKIYAI